MHGAGSEPIGNPGDVVADRAQNEHHGLMAVLETAGEIYSDALFSFVGPRRPKHWEEVLEHYEHGHPRSDVVA